MGRKAGYQTEETAKRNAMVYDFIREYGPSRRSEIVRHFPQMGDTTVQRTLVNLMNARKVDKMYIIPIGRYKRGGRKPDVYYTAV